MITIVNILMILIITGVIIFGIPLTVLALIFHFTNQKFSFLIAILFILIFFFSLFTFSSYIANTYPREDLSKSFIFTGSNLGETDIGSNSNNNFEQASSLHLKMISYNLTDPLSFLYKDIPHQGFNISRSIDIVQSNLLNISNYYLNTSKGLRPTLLKINASLTPFEKKVS